MGDIQYWEDTLTQELDSIQSTVQTLSRRRGDDLEKTVTLDKAERMLRRAAGTKRSYKMEIRLVNDPNERRRYGDKLLRHEETLQRFADEVQTMRSEMTRGELFLGADTGKNGASSPEADGDAMLKDASAIQEKTQTSLDNTRNMVAESKQVGVDTMEELRRQREQITSIDQEAMRMEDNLKRADRLIKTFGRRMATDKFIQLCACMNVMLLVGVVLYAIFKKGSGLKVIPGSPPSPVRMLRAVAGIVDEAPVEGDLNLQY